VDSILPQKFFEVQIADRRSNKRPKKRKFSLPHDVALLIFFGSLIFVLIVMMSWMRKTRERLKENNQTFEVTIESRYITEGLRL
jgi:hypothetical protein